MRFTDKLRSIEYKLRFYFINREQIDFISRLIGLKKSEMDKLKAVQVADLIFEGRLIKNRSGKFLSEEFPQEYNQFKVDGDRENFLKGDRIKEYLKKLP